MFEDAIAAPARGEPSPWSATPVVAAQRLGADLQRGLTSEEAHARLRSHGLNRLKEVRRTSTLRILLNQFASLIVILLAVATGVAFLFGEWLDGAAIAAVLLLNTLLGFYNELRAVQSMEALRRLGSVRATVRRDGSVLEVPAEELVPGDVVLLEAGDVITADLRLFEASRVEVDESALTGESVPVAKSEEVVAEGTPLADRTCMLFKGTAITRGTAEGLVVATGMKTELGGIAQLVQDATKEVTPLEERLAQLGTRLVWVVAAIASFTILVGVATGKPLLLMIETGIALAVAAIPEGLPIVATMALARGMARMARRHALINRLSAVETLGATTVVFTDKTGTLTENRMEVRCIVVSGSRVDREGRELRADGGVVSLESNVALRDIIEVVVLCNNATLDPGEPRGIGDPMEVALLDVGEVADVPRSELLVRFPEVREVAFEPATLMMATVHRDGDPSGPGFRFAIKGAAEAVLGASTSFLAADGERRTLEPAERSRLLEEVERLASDGLRVLAAAGRRAASADADPYEGLTFLGLVGLADPPRADVSAALSTCRKAGMRVVMVTGDHAGTARSIARAVGLIGDEAPPVVVGKELEQLEDLSSERRDELLARPVFARVTPSQKLGLIATYQRAGHGVARPGDGVNDAPALRKADIGVAMGLRGTQVAREAADMVLTDDSFASIVAAVEQGRIIFDNIRKFVVYLLSCNASEVLVVSLAAMTGGTLPLLPLQILFLNFVTDVFPALALAYGEGDPAILQRAPRDPKEPILTRRGWLKTGAFGLLLSVCVLTSLELAEGWLGYSKSRAVTVSFLTLAFAQLWHVFNIRSPGRRVLRNEITQNRWVWAALALCTVLLLASVYVPGLQTVLGTEAPGAAGWGLVAVLGSVPLIVGQLWLTFRGRRR